MANLEYKIGITTSGTAKLENGSYSEEAAPGSASKIEVKLTEDIAYGDLNGDGIGDAAVILLASGGGTGSFSYLAAVINSADGSNQTTNYILLGDRIKIQSISINSGIILVNYLDRTPEQSFAEEPTVEVVKQFKVQDGSLVVVTD